jgi:hypothetical protein
MSLADLDAYDLNGQRILCSFTFGEQVEVAALTQEDCQARERVTCAPSSGGDSAGL